jgi:hypothetical protein
MKVMGHPARGSDFAIELRRMATEPVQIDGAAVIVEEPRLAAVATLGDVMREFGEDCPSGAGQGERGGLC